MRRTFAPLCVLSLLAPAFFPAAALAQAPADGSAQSPAAATSEAFEKVTHIDFTEVDEVKGAFLNPDVVLDAAHRVGQRPSLIHLRTDFRPSLIQSADTL